MSLSLTLEQTSSQSLFATINRPQTEKPNAEQAEEPQQDALTKAIEKAERDKATVDLLQSAVEAGKRKTEEDLKGVRAYQDVAKPQAAAEDSNDELTEARRVTPPNAGLTEPFGGLPEGFSFDSASASYTEIEADGLSARFGELETFSVDENGISFNSVRVAEAQLELENGARVTVQQLQIQSVYIGNGEPVGGQFNRNA
ncbi:hypothetical protein [Coralliovum pocilloporae]|uniref:hypothetical protein n=1 Tax=Coralliovum pocilloporae TaxID=3066369 RepID=UPI003307B79C